MANKAGNNKRGAAAASKEGSKAAQPPAKRGRRTKAEVEATAAAAAAVPEVQEAAAEPEDPALEAVFEAIRLASNMPESCRDMLLALARGSLPPASDERHELQSWAVQLLGEAVQSVGSQLQRDVEAAAAEAVAVEGSKGGLEDALAAATAVLGVAAGALEGKRAEASQAEEQVAAAAAAAKESRAAHVAAEKSLVQLQESKARIEGILAGDLRPIMEQGGGDEGEVAQQHSPPVLALLEELKADESLISALPSVCNKKPADRGPFDTMVLQEVEKSLQEKVAALAEQLTQQGPVAQECAAALQRSEAEHAERREALAAALEARTAAEAEHAAAGAAVQAAQRSLDDFEPRLQEAARARDAKAAALKHYNEHNVEHFRGLAERRTVVVQAEATEAIETKAVAADKMGDELMPQAAAPVSVGGA